jgi:phage gp36-like protein
MYCSKQNLIDTFGNNELVSLTDRLGTGTIDDRVLNQAIQDASAIMDGYLGSRYQLPLANVPQSLIPLACNMTRYQLYDNEASEQVTERNKAALKFLESVAKGELSLGISTGGESATSTDFAEMQSAGSVFSRVNSSDFI